MRFTLALAVVWSCASLAGAQSTQPTTQPLRPRDLEITTRVLQSEGRWYWEMSLLNVSNHVREVPRFPRSLSCKLAEPRIRSGPNSADGTEHDSIVQDFGVTRIFEDLSLVRIYLSPGEGFVKRIAIQPQVPGKYVVSAAADAKFPEVHLSDCTFVVPEEKGKFPCFRPRA